MMNGSSSSGWQSNPYPTWWMITFPYDLCITGLKFKNGAYSEHHRNWNGRVWTSPEKSVAIGDQITAPDTNSGVFSVGGIPLEGVVTRCLYLEVTYAPYVVFISGLTITATRLTAPRLIDHLWAASNPVDRYIKY